MSDLTYPMMQLFECEKGHRYRASEDESCHECGTDTVFKIVDGEKVLCHDISTNSSDDM